MNNIEFVDNTNVSQVRSNKNYRILKIKNFLNRDLIYQNHIVEFVARTEFIICTDGGIFHLIFSSTEALERSTELDLVLIFEWGGGNRNGDDEVNKYASLAEGLG